MKRRDVIRSGVIGALTAAIWRTKVGQLEEIAPMRDTDLFKEFPARYNELVASHNALIQHLNQMNDG